MDKGPFVIGVDFGSDSVRTLIADTRDGSEIASAVFYYPRWKEGKYCEPSLNLFRQHPLDYIEGMEEAIKQCVQKAGNEIASSIRGIAIDTTGSTPVAVNKAGTPLALLPGFEKNPNAMFVLWKDHTAVKEAAEINEHAKTFSVNYLRYVGGIYSSEWFWAKLLHVLRADKEVRNAMYSWVEHCDWIPFLLTGGDDVTKMKRSICAAGHKALFSSEFGGLPPDDFFSSLDPLLSGFTSRLFDQAYTSDTVAGNLSAEWAKRLNLPEGIAVAVGGFDAHMGAVGGQVEPYHLSKVMGTSTCDMLVAPMEDMGDKLVRGICGQVPGSIIPGMMGMEAGQSSFGDAYAWFANIISWPLRHLLPQNSYVHYSDTNSPVEEIMQQIIPGLSREAAALPFDEHSEFALDWLNGRRTPDANQELKATLAGLNLGTTAPRLFRAIVESTCFGAKAIVDRFREEGIEVKGLIGLGGVAKKSPFIMQMMADVMNMPIRIHRSEQTCALGAAMFAATVAGIFSSVEEAMENMGQGFDTEYFPEENKVDMYKKRYKKYKKLGNFFENGMTVPAAQKVS